MRILRFFAALLLLCGTTRAAQAQSDQPDLNDAAFLLPTTEDTSLLWRISDGSDGVASYLYGTIHIIPEKDYFMPPTVVRAINDVDEVLFEIDPRDMQNPAVMMTMMDKIMMRNDTSLEDLLTEARFDSVANYFNDRGMPFMFFQRMKPMFLSAMVGQDMSNGNPFAGGGEDGSGAKSYEFELSQIADAGGKEIGGLETMDFQLGLFDSIPYTVQADMLYQTVADDMAAELADGDSQMDQMIALYKRRAVAEMAQLITSESEGFGNFEDLLVVRRNEKWVSEIADRLATPSMYAVGAGHLGGERGVIALLRAEGYTVEPVYE